MRLKPQSQISISKIHLYAVGFDQGRQIASATANMVIRSSSVMVWAISLSTFDAAFVGGAAENRRQTDQSRQGDAFGKRRLPF
ncbi:MAG: hypothetical protein H6667_12545 [Ardenticatenaceae bacterium]|nr:hypothetical protein [Ardenticatenaceae bacterium]